MSGRLTQASTSRGTLAGCCEARSAPGGTYGAKALRVALEFRVLPEECQVPLTYRAYRAPPAYRAPLEFQVLPVLQVLLALQVPELREAPHPQTLVSQEGSAPGCRSQGRCGVLRPQSSPGLHFGLGRHRLEPPATGPSTNRLSTCRTSRLSRSLRDSSVVLLRRPVRSLSTGSAGEKFEFHPPAGSRCPANRGLERLDLCSPAAPRWIVTLVKFVTNSEYSVKS